jgi:hypothetical protein
MFFLRMAIGSDRVHIVIFIIMELQTHSQHGHIGTGQTKINNEVKWMLYTAAHS